METLESIFLSYSGPKNDVAEALCAQIKTLGAEKGTFSLDTSRAEKFNPSLLLIDHIQKRSTFEHVAPAKRTMSVVHTYLDIIDEAERSGNYPSIVIEYGARETEFTVHKSRLHVVLLSKEDGCPDFEKEDFVQTVKQFLNDVIRWHREQAQRQEAHRQDLLKNPRKPFFNLGYAGPDDNFLCALDKLFQSQDDLESSFCIDVMEFYDNSPSVVLIDHTSRYMPDFYQALNELKKNHTYYRLIIEVITPQLKRKVEDRVDEEVANRVRAIQIPNGDFYYLFVTKEDGSFDINSDQELLKQVRSFMEYRIGRKKESRKFTPLQKSLSDLMMTMVRAREPLPDIMLHSVIVLDRVAPLPKFLGKRNAIMVLINGDLLPEDFSILDAADDFLDLDDFGCDFDLNTHVLPKTPVLFILIGGDENSGCSSEWKDFCDSNGHQFTVVAVANNKQVQVSDANRTEFDLFVDKIAAIH